MADNGKGSKRVSPIESRGREYDESSLSDLLSPDEKRPRLPGGFSDGEKPAIAHVDGAEDPATDPRPEPPISPAARELWRYVDDGEDEENRSSLVEFKEYFEEQYAELERKGMPEVSFFSALDPIMWTEVREEFGTVNWQASSPTRDPSLRPLPENDWETCPTTEEDPFTSPERDPFSPEQDPFASPDRLGDKVQRQDVVEEDAGKSAEKDSAEQRLRRTTPSKVKTSGGAASIAGGQSLYRRPPVPETTRILDTRRHQGKFLVADPVAVLILLETPATMSKDRTLPKAPAPIKAEATEKEIAATLRTKTANAEGKERVQHPLPIPTIHRVAAAAISLSLLPKSDHAPSKTLAQGLKAIERPNDRRLHQGSTAVMKRVVEADRTRVLNVLVQGQVTVRPLRSLTRQHRLSLVTVKVALTGVPPMEKVKDLRPRPVRIIPLAARDHLLPTAMFLPRRPPMTRMKILLVLEGSEHLHRPIGPTSVRTLRTKEMPLQAVRPEIMQMATVKIKTTTTATRI
ncbi:MAG: hypothetical protein Q9193_004159 [Seirophora villosa]